ncbi:MAG: class I SAM-dependent methyltransferase [Verrucomicrobiota bacterium]
MEEIINSIDQTRFEPLRRRYHAVTDAVGWSKYLDLNEWVAIHLNRARHLGLDSSPTMDILDIGCGAGYFLYIAKKFGHGILGVDMDLLPMFGELTKLLGVPRVTTRIEAFQPLPHLPRQFDFITAHRICFNGHKSKNLWGVAEWKFFLDDLTHYLKPDGRVDLQLNPERDGSFYSPELKTYFESRGAAVYNDEVLFPSGVLNRASKSGR